MADELESAIFSLEQLPERGAVRRAGAYACLLYTSYDAVKTQIRLAKENGIDFAVDIYPHYGSDVEATLKAGNDIRHGLIGPGVFASHGYERSHVDGVENTFRLIKAYLG